MPDFDGQLINILCGQVVSDIVVAGAVLAAEFARQWGQDRATGEWKESAVGNRVHAVAPRVVDEDLNALRQAFVRRELQAIVMAVCASVQLRYRSKARINGPAVREWRKASGADRLIAVHLRFVGLVYGARTNVLSSQI